MKLTPCGVDCSTCDFLDHCGKTCNELEGKPFYIKDTGMDTCMIYKCAVQDKGFKTCGECSDLPCEIYYKWKDPDYSDEEHAKGITERVERLKACKKE